MATWEPKPLTEVEDEALKARLRTAGPPDMFKFRQHATEEVITHPGGASSTRKPRFGLVPYVAFTEMAARFELGETKYKGKGCWNALSENRESALTREWVTARLEHVINHAFTAIEKIHGRLPDDGDSDAGGILFGGAALAEYLRLHKL